MKKSLFLTLLLGLSLSFSLFATNNPEATLVARTKLVKDKIIALQLVNLQQKATSINLTDLYENVNYFSKVVQKHNGYAKQLNLQQLKDGNYLLKIKSNGTTMHQVIRIRGDEILFSKFSS